MVQLTLDLMRTVNRKVGRLQVYGHGRVSPDTFWLVARIVTVA
jgi:hypothetical protein